MLLCGAFIAMVQATESRMRKNATLPRRANSATGGLLSQSQMGAIVVIIPDVLSHEAFQMAFVQNDHMIQQISTAASHPALGHSILPRTTKCGANWLTSQRSSRIDHIAAEL